jgi:hypothetical protein
VAADVNVEISLDRNKAYIGDRIRVELAISCDSAMRVDAINPGQRLGDFEISEWRLASLKSVGGKSIIEYEGIIAAFKTGKLFFPPIPTTYSAQAVVDTILTDSVSVYIMSLVMDDSTADIKRLKDVKSIARGLAIWIYLAAAGVAIAAIVTWFFLRRKRAGHLVPAAPPQPPWEEARLRLRKLRQAELEAKQYYIILSDIARTYIQRRYGFSALDMTTSEILVEAERLALTEMLLTSLQILLRHADLAKFARLVPAPEERVADWQRAWDFVIETSPATQAMPEVRA